MLLGILIIYALQNAYHSGVLSAAQASLALVMISILLVSGWIAFVVILIRRKKKWLFLLAGLLAAYFAILIVKWVPYFDGSEKTITPELIAQREIKYTKVNSGLPFYRDGPYYDHFTLQQCHLNDEEQAWAAEYIVDLDRYSYMVIGSYQLQSFRYTVWDSYDYAPAPFRGLTINPHWEVTSAPRQTVYIYRLPPIIIAPFY